LQLLDVVSGTVQVTAFLRFAALTEELINILPHLLVGGGAQLQDRSG